MTKKNVLTVPRGNYVICGADMIGMNQDNWDDLLHESDSMFESGMYKVSSVPLFLLTFEHEEGGGQQYPEGKIVVNRKSSDLNLGEWANLVFVPTSHWNKITDKPIQKSDVHTFSSNQSFTVMWSNKVKVKGDTVYKVILKSRNTKMNINLPVDPF